MWNALVDREMGFKLFSPEVLQAVRQARVVVIGTGGNGAVLDLLLRSGFEHFAIVDSDVVEDTNLNRLPFTQEAIGKSKVEAWKTYLESINPACEVNAYQRSLNRHDGPWLEALLFGQGWQGGEQKAALVFLGTTDPEDNLVAGRICGELGIRMLIGPASSGGFIVSTFTHDNGLTVERAGRFGTEATPLEAIDYEALAPLYRKALAYPGRAGRLAPGVGEAMARGELPARSCGIFVRLTNAAMAFEAIKNIAELNGLPMEGTSVVRMPLVRVFDPYTGCAYMFHAGTGAIGVPDWVDGQIRWHLKDGSVTTEPYAG